MEKKFYLSSTDKKLGGVCGGLADYFSVDSLIVRLAFVALVLGWGSGLLLYLLLWILAPKKTEQ